MSLQPITGPCCSTAAQRARPCRFGLAGLLLLLATSVAAADVDAPGLVDLLPPAGSGAWLRIRPTPVGPMATDWHRPGTPASLLLVVGVPVGQLGQLHWQAPLASPALPGLDNAPRQMRVSLALTASDPYADLRRGMLTRVELSGQTTLSLRPRGGKVMLHLTSRW